MDYDNYDAVLHYLWARVSPGVSSKDIPIVGDF